VRGYSKWYVCGSVGGMGKDGSGWLSAISMRCGVRWFMVLEQIQCVGVVW